jgi:hypothetical protein
MFHVLSLVRLRVACVCFCVCVGAWVRASEREGSEALEKEREGLEERRDSREAELLTWQRVQDHQRHNHLGPPGSLRRDHAAKSYSSVQDIGQLLTPATRRKPFFHFICVVCVIAGREGTEKKMRGAGRGG